MKELADFIRQGNNFAVISHVSPDGDTMGSAAALLYILKKAGKKGQWLCEGSIPADFMKIEEIASLVKYEKLDSFDSVISVDVSSPDRMGNCLELFKRTKRKAQFDHHITNTNFADVNVVKPYNAASFIVFDLLDELGMELDTHIARALYVGIATDTGKLTHAGVTAREVALASRLYEFPIKQNEISDILFATSTMTKMKLGGRAREHMASAHDGKLTYTYLTASDYAEFNAESSDSEGVVDDCRSVEGTSIAMFLRQIGDSFKVSMRCSEGYDVSCLCTDLGGGGHKLAAGCTVKGELDEVLDILIKKTGEIL